MRGRISSLTPMYHGWYVVVACMVTSMVIVGARNSLGVFVIPMSEDFGWSRGAVSLAASLSFLLNGLTQPLLGRMFDRLGGRRVILGSLILVGVSTVLLSLTFHIIFLIFIFGLVLGTAYSGASPANTGALIARWFRRKRSTALGLNVAGTAVGGLILIPLAAQMIEATNWRLTWLALGLIVLLVAVPLGFRVIHDGPEKLDLKPDGGSTPGDQLVSQAPIGRAGPLEATSWIDVFRSWPIWQISTAYFVDGFAIAIILIHFVPFAVDRDASVSSAALLFGLMMAVNIVGSALTGALADRMSRKTVLTGLYLTRGCAFLVVLVLPGSLGLWVFATVAGFSFISPTSLTTSLIADIYGLRVLGTIGGVAYSFRQIGGALGVLLVEYLFDITGSYDIPFAITGSLLLPVALVAFMVNEKKFSTRYQDNRA